MLYCILVNTLKRNKEKESKIEIKTKYGGDGGREGSSDSSNTYLSWGWGVVALSTSSGEIYLVGQRPLYPQWWQWQGQRRWRKCPCWSLWLSLGGMKGPSHWKLGNGERGKGEASLYDFTGVGAGPATPALAGPHFTNYFLWQGAAEAVPEIGWS